MPRGRSTDPETIAQVKRFAAFEPGHSFFVAGASVQDFEYLRAPVQRLGVGISIRKMARDPIYHVPGVRVYRKEGAYDQM